MKERRAFFDRRYVPTESRRAYRLAFILFWSVLLCLFFQRYVIGLGIVTERSMEPTLPEGSYFLINRYLYYFSTPRHGDVVVLRRGPYETDEYVKRVIALGGETLQIASGKVSVNGVELDEPYAVGGTHPDVEPMVLPERTCFLLGDNRRRSEDSRHFGVVSVKELDGRITPGKLFAFF